jgi:hypothetical protein
LPIDKGKQSLAVAVQGPLIVDDVELHSPDSLRDLQALQFFLASY